MVSSKLEVHPKIIIHTIHIKHKHTQDRHDDLFDFHYPTMLIFYDDDDDDN